MSERDLAITIIVLLSVLSVLTTPFVLMNRSKIKKIKEPKSILQKALIWSSNTVLVILLLWLAYYFGLISF